MPKGLSNLHLRKKTAQHETAVFKMEFSAPRMVRILLRANQSLSFAERLE
jgi:hypothetical protein